MLVTPQLAQQARHFEDATIRTDRHRSESDLDLNRFLTHAGRPPSSRPRVTSGVPVCRPTRTCRTLGMRHRRTRPHRPCLRPSYRRNTHTTSAPVQSTSAATNRARPKRAVVASRSRLLDWASVFISSPFTRLSPHSASRGLREPKTGDLVCPSHPWKPLVCSLAATVNLIHWRGDAAHAART
jgi:hypothetical protein